METFVYCSKWNEKSKHSYINKLAVMLNKKSVIMKKILILLLIISFSGNAQCEWKAVTMKGNTRVYGLKTDNTLWTWGWAYDGQPNGQIGNDNDWSMISAGAFHTMALKSNGTLWAWGGNSRGQLGIPYNPTNNYTQPIQVGTDNDWAYISAGNSHSTAVKTNGTLWTWGANDYGQLGNGTWTDIAVPTQLGNETDWRTVATSILTTIAIKTDNSIWAWGNNYAGALGDGTTIHKNSPVQSGLNTTDWKSVSVGGGHCLALKYDNTLWAWGANNRGQLGDGTTINRLTPIQIGNLNDWKYVTAFSGHSMAIKNDNSLWAWGFNEDGSIGNGTTIDQYTTIQVGTSNDWEALINFASKNSFCIKTDGTLWGWGSNASGQLNLYTTQTQFTTPLLLDCASLNNINFNELNKISIYPNPTKDKLFIDNLSNVENIYLTDITGKLLIAKDHIVSELDIENLKTGVYILTVLTNDKISSFKIIKN